MHISQLLPGEMSLIAAVPAVVIFFFLILTAEQYVEDAFLLTKLETQHQASREVG